MSEKTTILEGPDGRLYEIPDSALAKFAVPGEQVAALRQRLGNSSPSHVPPGHIRPGQAPAGFPPPPPELAGAGGGAATPASASNLNGNGTTLSIGAGPGGGGVTLNFFFQGAGAPGVAIGAGAAATSGAAASGVEGYHMTFDEHGIPTNHGEMLWGDYIDKQGHPAVGWHSHDPITGNAQ